MRRHDTREAASQYHEIVTLGLAHPLKALCSIGEIRKELFWPFTFGIR
jgi:hypothetical protein